MGLFGKNKKKKDAKGDDKKVEKKKVAKVRVEDIFKNYQNNLPIRSDISKNGVFEKMGKLQWTFAVGKIPGGEFTPSIFILKDCFMFRFNPDKPHLPTAKAAGVFFLKFAQIKKEGTLSNYPLLPHYNVFRIIFKIKHDSHYSFFFKCDHASELDPWIEDLTKRCEQNYYYKRQKMVDEVKPLPKKQATTDNIFGMVVEYPKKKIDHKNDMDLDAEEHSD